MKLSSTLFARIAFVCITAAFLAGCASIIRSEVTRFHDFDKIEYSGSSIIVLPYKEQEQSLEFRLYANMMSDEFLKYGFRQAESLSDADFVAFLSYGIDQGQTRTVEIPVHGQTGGGTTTYSGTTLGSIGRTTYRSSTFGTAYTPPTFGQIGTIPITTTTYMRALVIMVLSTHPDQEGQFPTVFEARVRSMGSRGEISTVVPTMIQAALSDFPGASGETKSVSLSAP